MRAKKGQVTLFIIVAIVVVAAAVFGIVYFNKINPASKDAGPIEDYFIACASGEIKEAAKIAEMQGGWMELPEYEEGSSYLPFSNRLNFIGLDIPYWFYISGNNLAKEQKPSLSEIEKQMANYLEENLDKCGFSSFSEKGYTVSTEGNPEVSVSIKQSSIDANIVWPITVSFESKTTSITAHKASANTAFGELYDSAEKIFEAEQEELFLENYSIDALRLYAPVDGIELSCAPKIWSADSVKQDLQQALSANIGMIKAKGTYYDASDENRYFEFDVGKSIAENVHFLYSADMPTKFEVWPSENGILRADPIGKQEGLGILSAIGFCYVPYHFVYSVSFPVLVQISSEDEIFQFPMIVVIDKSQARNATAAEEGEAISDICEFKTQKVEIFTYDENTKPLEADIYYKCFSQACPVGETKISGGKASLSALVPKCYNGLFIAKVENYSDSRQQISTNAPLGSVNLFLNPRHILSVEPGISGDKKAIISFTGKDYSTSIYWPEQKSIELVEGDYNVTVQLFKDSEMILPAQSGEQCIKVPAEGITGILGQMREECFEVELPQDTITSVLFGGGSAEFYVTEQELNSASSIKISIPEFSVPTSINDLAEIYGKLESSKVEVELK